MIYLPTLFFSLKLRVGFLFLLFITSAHADLGTSKEWKALLHYKKNNLGFERSEIDGGSFFLSQNGKTDSEAELKESIRAFELPATFDQQGESNDHAFCKLPARYQWLINHGVSLKIDPRINCKSYRTFRNRVQAKRVSIVFSSYYLGSASSAFGHSFLRFSGDNENELFDTGINFTANPTTTNPVLYAIYGLIGVFPASFSTLPFYVKIREYNDFEARDLWSYELNLTPEQKSFLLDHLWELGNTYFDYFYFNENCSYHILRAIEAAIPSIQFYSHRPVYVIPSDSIKSLYEVPGLVKAATYRPSIRSTAYERFSHLNSSEQNEVLEHLNNKSIPTTNKVPVLDTLIDAIDMNFASEILKQDPLITEWKQSVLKKRASLNQASPRLDLEAPLNEAPHVGHGSKRLDVGYGVLNGSSIATQTYTDIRLRASHHDLLDPSVGYPRHLHIDFGKIGFRYYSQTKNFVLNELNIVDLTALSMQHPLASKISYTARIGFNRTIFADCRDPLTCPATSARGGIGKTLPLFGKHTFFMAMNLMPSYGTLYTGSHFKFAAMPMIESIFELDKSFKIMLQAESRYTFLTDHPFSNEFAFETRKVWDQKWGLDLRAALTTLPAQAISDVMVRGMVYF